MSEKKTLALEHRLTQKFSKTKKMITNEILMKCC